MSEDLELRAREALENIKGHGIGGLGYDEEALQYGIDHKLMTQKEINAAQAQYLKNLEVYAKKLFGDYIERHG